MSDLISRNALIRRFAYYHAHSYGKAEYAYGVAVEEALKAPTVDAVPVVHGRWENEFGGYRNCSECGCEHPIRDARGFLVDDDYCPHCGAKMDGGADNG